MAAKVRSRIKPFKVAEKHIQNKTDRAGLEQQYINSYKGRGVFATESIHAGDFVVEYRGELLSEKDCAKRLDIYTESEKVFIFDFQWKGKSWCVDAAQEDGSYGRLVNDEHKKPNCRMKILEVDGEPHLCLFAVEDISPGEEITYDYGNSKWPWRVKMAGQQRMDLGAECTEMVLGTTEAPEKAGSNQKQTSALPLNSLSMDKLLNDSACAAQCADEASGAAQPQVTTEIDALNLSKGLSTAAESELLKSEDRHLTQREKRLISLLEKLVMQLPPGVDTSSMTDELLTITGQASSQQAVMPGDMVCDHGTHDLDELNTAEEHSHNLSKDTRPELDRRLSWIQGLRKHHRQCESRFNGSLAEKLALSRQSTLILHQKLQMNDSLVKRLPPSVDTSGMGDERLTIPEQASSHLMPGNSQAIIQPTCKATSSKMEQAIEELHESSAERSFSDKMRDAGLLSVRDKLGFEKTPVHNVEHSMPQMKRRLSNREIKLQSGVGECSAGVGDFSDSSDISNYSDKDYVPETDSSSSENSDSVLHLLPKKPILTHRFPQLNVKQRRAQESLPKQGLEQNSSKGGICSSVKGPEESGSGEVSSESSVTVKPSLQTGSHRVYNKKHYCLYCWKPFSKMGRHLERAHRREPDVFKAVLYPKHSRERRMMLNRLRNRGNFAHNSEVARNGSGEMVACHRPAKIGKPTDFIHCLYCQGLYCKRSLWKHVKDCPFNTQKGKEGGRKYVRSQCALFPLCDGKIGKGLQKIVANMTYDEVTLIVKNEKYILQLGEHMFNKMGSDTNRHEYIRQKMREVARLLIEARKSTPLSKMQDFVQPSNFHHVITAVKNVAGYNAEDNTYKIPSLALKLGHSLQKICGIVESDALIDGDQSLAESARRCMQIHKTRWNEFVSAGALTTLKEAKWNKPQLLPFTQDVKVLHAHLEKRLQESEGNLQSSLTKQAYSELAKVALTQVILFNRRRAGEVSRLPLSTYTNRVRSELHEDLAICVSDVERVLCQHFTRIELRGKRGRMVPVLLKPSVVSALDLLVKTRQACDVPAENPFLFGRPCALSYYRGGDCIRKFAEECGAKNPEALSSTKLRKHIATMAKVLNLNESEQDQLADFLGHDIRVHREHYRLPQDILQLAKMSKVLLAMEKGNLSAFKGQNLDDIAIDPEEKPDSADDLTSSGDESDPDFEAPLSANLTDSSSRPNSSTSTSAQSIGECSEAETQVHQRQGLARHPKRKWEPDEVEAVERHLKNFIRICKVPGKSDCIQCLQAEPHALQGRTWTGIKFYVKNRITTLKRKTCS